MKIGAAMTLARKATGRRTEIRAEHQPAHHAAPMVGRFRTQNLGETGKALRRLMGFGALDRLHPIGVIERQGEGLRDQDAADHQGGQPLR